MQFIAQNWTKLLIRCIGVGGVGIVLLSSNDWSSIRREYGLLMLFAALFILVPLTLNVIAYYFFTKEFQRDKVFIGTLFDNGRFIVAPSGATSWYQYTRPGLRGFISGYPVAISYRHSTKFDFRFDVDIYVADPGKPGESRKESYSTYSYGMLNVFDNVKPEIEEFVESLKKEGCIPGKVPFYL